jgi:hypothetical protein
MSKNLDLSPLFHEPDANIKVTRRELMKLCMKADAALDASDNNDELAPSTLYTVLYDIRETLSEFLEEPERRIR